MPGMEVMLVASDQGQSLKLLSSVYDEYGGVIVDMANQPMDAAVFSFKLRASISHWRKQVEASLGIRVRLALQ
jgi:predicted glycosyltransferase